MTTATFLLEIGVEELPSSFLRGALGALPALVESQLAELRLPHGSVRALGSPRRITVLVEEVADTQTALDEEVVGPPRSVAYDASGQLTKAGAGFASKMGVRPEDLRVVSTEKGEYLAARRSESGKEAHFVLRSIVEETIRRTPFPKSMRWGEVPLPFGRPIQWIIALYGDRVVEAEIAGIRTGRETQGHRFLHEGPIAIDSAASYVDQLHEAHVIVDPSERRATMVSALEQRASELQGVIHEDEFLLRECTDLVEEPHIVPGSFDPGFLELPEGVVISVMRDHQRYFSLRDKSGRLMAQYLNVVNTAVSVDTIQKGNDRVLNARLADARFFVEEDRKTPLDERTPQLDKVVFHRKLGSVGDKVRRVEQLAVSLAPDSDREVVQRAARLMKADLVTLVVGEFPELQGEMGRIYALEQGEPVHVADAIRDHYLPKGASDSLPTERAGWALAIADRLDTLVGGLGAGLAPSGSSDPFALRRAAIGIIRLSLECEAGIEWDLRSAVEKAYRLFSNGTLAQGENVIASMDEFIRARLKALYASHHPNDLLAACLGAWDGRSLRDFEARLTALARFRELPAYESLAIAFKRAYNIAGQAPEGEIVAALLETGPERELASRFDAVAPRLDAATQAGSYDDAFRAVAEELRVPIDRFFEEVFVMVDDPAVRENRLRLLGSIARSISRLAHFHELST